MHATRSCSVEGCSDPHLCRGLCNKHYHRVRRHGSLENKPQVSIEDRFWSKVDKTPTCWLWQGATHPNGYGTFNIGQHRMRGAHRVSYELAYGPIEAGLQVDHICRVRACVRPDHLRLTTSKQNNEHRSPVSTIGRSGVRGVQWEARCRKWFATTEHNGQTYTGGYFDSIEDAARAVRELRNRLHTHNNLDRI